MSARIAALALALVLLLLPGQPVPAAGAMSPASPSPSPSGMIGVRLLDVPVARAEDPRALTYIVDHLAPGTTIHRRIEVSNTTQSTAAVSVYEAAARVDQGAFTPAPGREANRLTGWTTLDQSAVEVPSGQARPVTVTITVPHDAAGGEHYGVVWAEVRSTSPGAVTVVNRVGIRIYLSVGAGREPESAMRIDAMTAGRTSDGRPVVTAQVTNIGGRALDVAGRLTLSAGPGGLSGGPYATDHALSLTAGQSGTTAVPLDGGLPDGPWNAQLELSSGTTNASAERTITFPARSEQQASDLSGWGLLAAAAGALLLLLATGLVTRAARRRRASAVRVPPAAP